MAIGGRSLMADSIEIRKVTIKQTSKKTDISIKSAICMNFTFTNHFDIVPSMYCVVIYLLKLVF